MPVNKHHPKRAKKCVFCKFWFGNADLDFVNSAVGYAYEAYAKGKCTKKNGASTQACYSCSAYVPNLDAERLL